LPAYRAFEEICLNRPFSVIPLHRIATHLTYHRGVLDVYPKPDTARDNRRSPMTKSSNQAIVRKGMHENSVIDRDRLRVFGIGLFVTFCQSTEFDGL